MIQRHDHQEITCLFYVQPHNGESQRVIHQHVAHIQPVGNGAKIYQQPSFQVDNRPFQQIGIEDQQTIQPAHEEMKNITLPDSKTDTDQIIVHNNPDDQPLNSS